MMNFKSAFFVPTAVIAVLMLASHSHAAPNFVISGGYEDFFAKILDVSKAPGKWQNEGTTLQPDHVEATFVNKAGVKAVIVLKHPDSDGPNDGKTERFMLQVKAGGKPAKTLAKYLLARIKTHEDGFQWMAVKAKPATDAQPASALSIDSLPPRKLPEPNWDLGLQTAVDNYKKAIEAIGDKETSAGLAAKLAKDSPMAAASVYRRIGEFDQAVAVLEKASGPKNQRLDQELALSYLMANKTAEAEKLIGPDICAKTNLFLRGLAEGRAADVQRIWQGIAGKTKELPRCAHFLQVKTAYALNDADAVEAAAQTALEQLGEDEDLLFLWGSFYFDDFFNRVSLGKATKPWGILARKNLHYPGLLGAYGAAEEQSGQLDTARVDELFAAWEKDKSDIVSGYLAGMGMHYLGQFERSIPALLAAYREVPEEPRIGMYLAMAYYFSGQQEPAQKVLDEINHMAYNEPDIAYCRSTVWRYVDHEKSTAELALFLKYMDEPDRFCFEPGKMANAKRDYEALKKGETPKVRYPNDQAEVPNK
ncbi:MAG TPA: hypothetical protein PK329_01925 [Myxococcota bacterium]|jgi:tetratricopeptide (TPR) repeat protein|nr:hypothetical protein [Myxococcota bacterium]HON24591.1 hypothetical protein [Myxococcota bacterium]HPC91059.1 hypothetical protein [Myxococcota bacterium]HQE72455.1 hypothetical protein [Myxococcota bacterium]HQI60864.1 hypothetical protein [Myxococcota bacterium]